MGQTKQLPKPAHLSPRYGQQFSDASVARAYHTRPPYPAEFFDVIDSLHAPGQRRILELGCGTGDVTLGLVGRAEQIDAIEPSAAMFSIARQRRGANDQTIRWICESAETERFDGPYSLAVAAESLHWMEWSLVLPKIAGALAPDARLIIAERESAGPMPWDAELGRLIARYSTNQEYRPYKLVDELTQRELFTEVGQHTTAPLPFSQSIADHIESIHSRNGFSRDRMGEESAREFDHQFRRLLKRHRPDGVVRFKTVVKMVWGVPRAG